jgi:hypothetical protein
MMPHWVRQPPSLNTGQAADNPVGGQKSVVKVSAGWNQSVVESIQGRFGDP